MTKLLRRDARFRDSDVRFAVSFDSASVQWRQKLCEKSLIVVSKSVLGFVRRVLSREVFVESGGLHGCRNITFEGCSHRESDVSVLRSQRGILWCMRQRMKSVKPMRPTSNDDHVPKPWTQCIEE